MAYINDYFNEVARNRFSIRSFDDGPRPNNTHHYSIIVPPTPTPTQSRFIADFTTQSGGIGIIPSGFEFARDAGTGDETVQTSESTVVSGIGTNIARVGRSAISKNFGLVIECSTVNLVEASRWRDVEWSIGGVISAGITDTYSASGATGPDGTGSPKKVQIISGGHSRYLTNTSLPLANKASTFSLWVRAGAGTSCAYISNGAINVVTTALSSAWVHATTTLARSVSGVIAVVPQSGQNLISLGGPAASARDAIIDFLQLENLPFTTEVTSGTRQPDKFKCTFDRTGRLNLILTFRPKTTAANYYVTSTSNYYFLYVDSNNHISINMNTRIVTVVVGGLSHSFSTAIPVWAADDVITLSIMCGGSTYNATASVSINGSTTSLGSSANPMTQEWGNGSVAYIMSNGSTQVISCWLEKADITVINDESSIWLNYLEAPQVGGTWTTLPDGWTYSRTGNAETVQISESELVSGIGTNIARVGRKTSSTNFGLVIEENTINRLSAQLRNIEFPNSPPYYVDGTTTYSAGGVVGPDGTGSPKRAQIPNASFSRYYFASVASKIWTAGSAWIKGNICLDAGDPFQQAVAAGWQGVYVNSPTWFRVNTLAEAKSGGSGIAYMFDGRVLPLINGDVSAGARDAIVDYIQYEDKPYCTEVSGGTRGQDVLTATPVHNNGKMSLYLKHRPKMSSTQLSRHTSSSLAIIYGDISNCITIAVATRLVTIYSGGNSHQLTNAVPTWNADDIIEWAIECGGDELTTGTVWINGTPTILGTSISAQPDFAINSVLILHGHPSVPGCISSWVEEIGFYA